MGGGIPLLETLCNNYYSDENHRWKKNKWKNIVLLLLGGAIYYKLLVVIFPEKLNHEKYICMALVRLDQYWIIDFYFNNKNYEEYMKKIINVYLYK